jgi:hypothetical protein
MGICDADPVSAQSRAVTSLVTTFWPLRANASGAQSFPPTWREFCRALSTLVGNRAFN